MLADVFVKVVFIKFGMPVFFSHFWLHFCYYLKIRLRYSIAFYSQTDGQTKHQNQTLEQNLQSYVKYQQNNQVYQLPLAKYVYNNNIYATTQQSLFQAIFEKEMQQKDIIQDNKNIKVSLAQDQALNLALIKTKLNTWVKKVVSQILQRKTLIIKVQCEGQNILQQSKH